MFRHIGNTRTMKHNLQIASLLSFVAGLVNVAGFLSVAKLTTNVTGHFAFLVDEVFKFQFLQALIYLFYIFSFFLGSFISNLLVEISSRINEKYIFIIPVCMEISLLAISGFFSDGVIERNPDLIAAILLFSMGLQNSLVTTISNSVVRTTHLTGLFTDLGIELSQLFFYKSPDQRNRLILSIRLRLTIIFFFFTGGVVSGLLYNVIEIKVLLMGAALLLSGLFFDTIKFRLLRLKSNIQGLKNNFLE